MNKQNGFSQNIAILAVVGVLVVAGIAWAIVSNNDKQGSDAMIGDKMQDDSIKNDDQMMQDESMKPSDDQMMDDDKMVKQGAYLDYSEATVAAEQAKGNRVVLFFHAPWCPFCKAANIAFMEKTSEIPAGVTVLKTDYDSNTELKQKYGVTYQHTFVQVDNDQNQVSKWNGGDVDNLKKYLK